MRDYELTVEDLNSQLAEKNTRIGSLESEVEREQGRCSSLQEQLSHLTTQEATERERAEKMKVSATPPSLFSHPIAVAHIKIIISETAKTVYFHLSKLIY